MKEVRTIDDILKLIEQNNEAIKGFGVEQLGIFGSFVKGEQTRQSDVDVLVQFKADRKNFKNFMGLAYFLEDLLGRKVELVTVESISPYIKPHILETIEYVKVA